MPRASRVPETGNRVHTKTLEYPKVIGGGKEACNLAEVPDQPTLLEVYLEECGQRSHRPYALWH